MRLPNELGTKSRGTIAVRGCSVNICMIGAGYVGLVSAACFSEFGWNVTCIDKDADKIEQLCRGHMPIYEPRLDELLERNLRNGRIEFSTDLGRAVAEADLIFLAVGTPILALCFRRSRTSRRI
jgi:UDPglucose 6-dehydrogenase